MNLSLDRRIESSSRPVVRRRVVSVPNEPALPALGTFAEEVARAVGGEAIALDTGE